MRAPNKKSAGKKVGASKGKLALVGVLGAVLVGVIAMNFTGDGDLAASAATPPVDAASSAVAPPIAATSTSPGSSNVPSGPFGEFETDRPWPNLALDVAKSFDPLAAPEWAQPPKPTEVAASPEKAERQAAEDKVAKEVEDQEAAAREAALAAKQKAELAALREAANAIILVSAGERVARIGDQEFHIGDEVGGLTIQSITPEGIVLGDPR